MPTLDSAPSVSDEPLLRATDAASSSRQRKSLMASTVGNLLEWYEWSSYAVLAPFIAKAMFDSADPSSALLSTLAVFAVGFLVRPLGGLFFGRLADRRGRKFVLVTTMLMMAVGSLAIGILPTYATMGVGASILLLVIRMMQGFAHGGESATTYSYVSELARPHRRGLWSSFVCMAIFGGSVIAYTVGGGITSLLSNTDMTQWGWRIPFLAGAVFAVVVLFMRRNMEESDVFQSASKAAVPTKRLGRRLVGKIALMVALTSGLTVAHYTWSSYISTFAITQRGMDASAAFWVTTFAQLIALLSLPMWGMLSDRIGRRPVMIAFAVMMSVAAIPLKAMITDDPWTLLIASSIALVIVAGPAAISAAILAEAFPTKVRTQAIGLAYSLAVAAFGGSAPYMNALFMSLGHQWLGSVYIMVLCACTAVAALIMKETRGIDLRNV